METQESPRAVSAQVTRWLAETECRTKHFDTLIEALEEIEALARVRTDGYNFGEIAHKALLAAKE